jgi:hypothetical protein
MDPVHGLAAAPLTAEHLASIGLVATNWAALETLVSSAIWQIGEIPDEIGACVTSQIYTLDGKIKALVSLLRVRGGLDRVVGDLNAFHSKAQGASEKRNRVVHDPWVADAVTGVAHRLQVTANKKLVYGHVPQSTEELKLLATEISGLVDRFDELIRPALARFPAVPLPSKSP